MKERERKEHVRGKGWKIRGGKKKEGARSKR